jgi:membrane associated rhomboid family serine protease
MGIYDRDYSRDEQSGHTLSGPKTMVTTLIVINVVIYLVDWIFLKGEAIGIGRDGKVVYEAALSKLGALSPNLFSEPWKVYQLLTYGFLHAMTPMHIAGNMYVLWMFGREIEGVYGRTEFLRIYLTMIVLAGLVWVAQQQIAGPSASGLVGASGAVTGIVVLYALHFPKRTILLFFVLPAPMWVVGVLFVAADVFGAFGSHGDVAYIAHLTGAAFAFLYFRGKWNLGRLTRGLPSLKLRGRGPRLKVHDPDAGDRKLDRQVDDILEKISRDGEDSLTRKERKMLEDASRRAQRRRDM